ncbi:MAG: FHA domain-containing protein [Deltaproteobacteria bacterium]|nr:FHA domain-containing protein [Deltaproteobacteria bacterium]
MLRFTVTEDGHDALPAIDLDGARVVLGSSPAAQLRLPAEVARDEHVVISDGRWVALGAVSIDGAARASGDSGPIGTGVTLAFGVLRVAIAPSPSGSIVSPPQRTESLALELVRNVLGANAAPAFEVQTGPRIGARCSLPPPLATLIIGRGDESTWVILDEDLSRTHAEVRRGWDGVTIEDLDSKNGTKVDGTRISAATALHHGAVIHLGKVVLRFSDPAEAHLRGDAGTLAATPLAKRPVALPPPAAPAPSPWPFVLAATIAGAAIAGLAWVLVT